MVALVLALLLAPVLTAALLIIYRLSLLLDPKRSKPLRHGRRNPNEPTHLLIVLGSGGHTTEMMSMLHRAVTNHESAKKLNWRDYSHRTWVVSGGDSISAERAKEFEEKATGLSTQAGMMAGKVKHSTDIGPGTYDIVTVPRAREIHQPLLTTPASALKCMLACRDVLLKHTTTTRDGHLGKSGEIDFPDLILCNGPATATIMVFTSILLRFFDTKGCSTRGKMRTIYVESWARVKKLSLSGKLLSRMVDRFLVQWPQLERIVGGRAEYLGVMV